MVTRLSPSSPAPYGRTLPFSRPHTPPHSCLPAHTPPRLTAATTTLIGGILGPTFCIHPSFRSCLYLEQIGRCDLATCIGGTWRSVVTLSPCSPLGVRYQQLAYQHHSAGACSQQAPLYQAMAPRCEASGAYASTRACARGSSIAPSAPGQNHRASLVPPLCNLAQRGPGEAPEHGAPFWATTLTVNKYLVGVTYLVVT